MCHGAQEKPETEKKFFKVALHNEVESYFDVAFEFFYITFYLLFSNNVFHYMVSRILNIKMFVTKLPFNFSTRQKFSIEIKISQKMLCKTRVFLNCIFIYSGLAI